MWEISTTQSVVHNWKEMENAMREMEFKMERQGLVKEGERVTVLERKAPTNYYYIMEPAVAMSGCYFERERLKSTEGVVKEIKQTETGFYVIAEFEE